MLAETTSFTLDGIAARMIRVEVDVHRGLPNFQIVGLPDAAVREARERVRAATVNCGFDFPLQRITASLAPADLRKAGPAMDLALATALLGAAGDLKIEPLAGWSLVGELALDGSVRPVRGALAMAEEAREQGRRGVIVPTANGPEAALAEGITVLTIDNFGELASLQRGEIPGRLAIPAVPGGSDEMPDLADLRGQGHLRAAVEISAAGGHGLLMIGPPGAGKSLAARRLPSVLPPLAGEEVLEVARIASACGIGDGRISSTRPFRAPHHTVSAAGLVGGGSPPRPGEITLAHRGVLFLDELCEFNRPALEALREPLESGSVTIARARGRQTLPCRFTLVAAANPCPCGRGEEDPRCRCSEMSARRYRAALSGALVDRIDLVVAVTQPSAEALAGPPGEESPEVRKRVILARELMAERLGDGRTNSEAEPDEVANFKVTAAAAGLLAEAHRSWQLSGRAHGRILRVARTVADLAGSTAIGEQHMATAIQFRRRSAQ
ncbi:MAG TPA: YifB family Mg chelatase-like AAA ATPase [Solirubrobacterales bacterium]|jgi:magnesium chelatase family protein|nr:YifB family Mg chelatase-like AAA ATPase [Solirubrobacterales bacterium]HMY26615.1 YifB family Mg chelatase-like AAA ATPase [Solirubrobacterales bacterium]HNA23471.1 YifB family Mg chelatase-like AAA ATPase [Solirubrobacterales bacterium]HNC93542.1 YifB family Mg chelatase-like AAA ATPase [Solirubrobacterales bacterium]HNE78693.1 YifB family Mg chelatase-like AAA ATPase [Solirubrobacterales bacterium]